MRDFFIFFGIGVWGIACVDIPVYDETPFIRIEDIRFKRLSTSDSLVVTIRIQDGDGDLGLRQSEITYPYNSRIYPLFNGNFIRLGDIDTLPPFKKPYTCFNWVLKENAQGIDTIYTQINPNHYNFTVDLYIKKSGTYKKFDLTQYAVDCPESEYFIAARFPVLSDNLSEKAPIEGTITYGYEDVSSSLFTLFRFDSMIVQVQIKDRQLNASNRARSDPFTLAGIAE